VKTIGLLGGMSWESTIPYYQIINRTVNAHLGGLHSAKILLHSVDFHEIEQLQHAGAWDKTGGILAQAAQSLQAAGADCLVLCTNTMHRVADAIQRAIEIPLLHIADAVANNVRDSGIRGIGLLGTKFTMEQAFYRDRLSDMHGLTVLIPDKHQREAIHRVIYEELCAGNIKNESRAQFAEIIRDLAGRGAEGMILGCTEISLLVKQEDSPVPLFDTTEIHARGAALWALS